jgi:CheY-like chemotaxis protein
LPRNANKPVLLIAEDEGLIMTVARMALEREGYLVLTAENGEEALDVSRKFPGSIHALVADLESTEIIGVGD